MTVYTQPDLDSLAPIVIQVSAQSGMNRKQRRQLRKGFPGINVPHMKILNCRCGCKEIQEAQ